VAQLFTLGDYAVMKKLIIIPIISVPIIAAIFLTGYWFGYGKPSHVSASEFEEDYKIGIESMNYSHFLGQLNDRAYICIGSMNLIGDKWTEEIAYVELSELDKHFRDSLPQKKP
jgi:hypothetical protein